MRLRVISLALTLLGVGIAWMVFNPSGRPVLTGPVGDGEEIVAHVSLCDRNVDTQPGDCYRFNKVHITIEVNKIPVRDVRWGREKFEEAVPVPRGAAIILTADQIEAKYLRCWFTRVDSERVVGTPDQTLNPGPVVCHYPAGAR